MFDQYIQVYSSPGGSRSSARPSPSSSPTPASTQTFGDNAVYSHKHGHYRTRTPKVVPGEFWICCCSYVPGQSHSCGAQNAKDASACSRCEHEKCAGCQKWGRQVW
ncbi:hypothetical protein LZ554_004773 [Drepanopeziza brunnea f. sp. 'monogermtubi']|nr:hypothetical protein LZ554_004773 [Drepanopeziza brunnea f. sp. 'monogermtubi']